MLLDFEVVTQQWALIAALVAGPMIFKFALISALAKVFRVANGPSLKTGLWLCQAGEFGFVLLDPAGLSGIVPAEILQPIQAAMVISMLLAPFIIERSDGWILRVVRNEWLARSLELHRIAAQTMGSDRHVIVCGFGRCGQNLAQMLDGEKVPYVALDLDPQRTREAAAAGQSVVFGDAARKETLVAAGIHRANSLVITYADRVSAIHVIHTARHLAPALPIVVRSMLASHALALAGVPLHRVIRRIREVRDTRYAMLRGYFHGSTDDANERGSDILLKSFSVPVVAGCVGQHLEALGLIEIGVEVNNIRRGRMQLELDQNLVIQAGDVIVMRGSSEALAIAEELLSGRPA